MVLNWVFCPGNSEEKLENSQKKLWIFLNILKFSKYLEKYPDSCVKAYPKAKKKKKTWVRTYFFILSSACAIILLIAYTVPLFHIKNRLCSQKVLVVYTFQTWSLAHFLSDL